MDITKAGQFIKLFRLLTGLDQSEIADYLETRQAVVAQLENNKYKTSPHYIHTLSGLFFLNPAFLSDLQPPVFKHQVSLFTIKTAGISSVQLLNQIDKSIRNIFPSLLNIAAITDIFVFTAGPVFFDGNKIKPSLFLFYSSKYDQMILIRVIESERSQFFNALSAACDKAQLAYDSTDVPFAEFEEFLTADEPYDDDSACNQFNELLSLTRIPEYQLFVDAFSQLKPNDMDATKQIIRTEIEMNEMERKRSNIIDGVLDLIMKHDIRIKEIREGLQRHNRSDLFEDFMK